MILSLKTLIFLKRFGTLYDLLNDLLNEKISTDKAVKEEDEMIKNRGAKRIHFIRRKRYYK